MPIKTNRTSVKGSAESLVERVRNWVDKRVNAGGEPDCVRMLEEQHMLVRKLFGQIESAKGVRERRALFDELLTSLAIHTEMEEKVFYPAMKRESTGSILLESMEEHLAVKRLLADLIEMHPADDRWMAKIAVLRESVEHHAREEERILLPRALAIFDAETRMALTQEMVGAAVALIEGEDEDVRTSILAHTGEAAPI